MYYTEYVLRAAQVVHNYLYDDVAAQLEAVSEMITLYVYTFR